MQRIKLCKMMTFLLSVVLMLAFSAGRVLAEETADPVEAEGVDLVAVDYDEGSDTQSVNHQYDDKLIAMESYNVYEKNIDLGKEYSRTTDRDEIGVYYFTVDSDSMITVRIAAKAKNVYVSLENWPDGHEYDGYNKKYYIDEWYDNTKSSFIKTIDIPKGKYRLDIQVVNEDGGSYTFSIDKKPTWSGASSLPVRATADVSVTNGGYIRLKSGGKWVTSDAVLSLSAPSTTTKRITAKAAGTTTLYLLDSSGKQVASKKVTVYKIHGKTYELESSVDSSYVLDIQGGSKKDGAQLIVYKRNGGDNQRYQCYLQDDGTYAIRSLKSKKWLTVESKSNKYVQQMSWRGGGSQTWTLTVDSSNRVTFINVGTKKCFDVQGGKTKNSAKMIVWQSNGGKNQKWKLNKK